MKIQNWLGGEYGSGRSWWRDEYDQNTTYGILKVLMKHFKLNLFLRKIHV